MPSEHIYKLGLPLSFWGWGKMPNNSKTKHHYKNRKSFLKSALQISWTRWFTKSNTAPWVFFTFINLCKWYQIAKRITKYQYVESKEKKKGYWMWVLSCLHTNVTCFLFYFHEQVFSKTHVNNLFYYFCLWYSIL